MTVYDGCEIGDRVDPALRAWSSAPTASASPSTTERWVKVPQIGRVRIGNDVEIGANTTVDRGAIDDTVIEDGVKLDNQIQIAHNVRIGAHTAIAACTGIAGSAQHRPLLPHRRRRRHRRARRIADHVEISGHTLDHEIDRRSREPTPGCIRSSRTADWRRNAAQLRHLARAGEARARRSKKNCEQLDKERS